MEKRNSIISYCQNYSNASLWKTTPIDVKEHRVFQMVPYQSLQQVFQCFLYRKVQCIIAREKMEMLTYKPLIYNVVLTTRQLWRRLHKVCRRSKQPPNIWLVGIYTPWDWAQGNTALCDQEESIDIVQVSLKRNAIPFTKRTITLF